MNKIPAFEFKLKNRPEGSSGPPGFFQQMVGLVSNLFVEADRTFSIEQLKWISINGWFIPSRFPGDIVRSIIDSNKATGSDWTNDVFVYRDVGNGSRLTEVDIISHDRLEWELETIIGTRDEIRNIFIYKHKLFCLQVTDFILYHNFVLFETGQWFVTIEKNTKGILIQRSMTRSGVHDYALGKERNTPITLEKKEKARGRIIDLIDWLHRTQEQLRTYHVLSDNCQLFSYRVNDCLTSWVKKIYLYRDVGSGLTLNRDIRLMNANLLSDFKKVIDVKELINEVTIYKQEHPSSPPGNQGYRYFVLFKSENWYWTIEKNNKYTILQRSKHKSGVKEYVQGKARENPRRHEDYHGQANDNKKLKHLIQHLYTSEELKTSAVPFSDNEEFACSVYDCITLW